MVIDRSAQLVTGWAITDRRRTELVEDSLMVAALCRGLAGAICQPGHVPQLRSEDFTEIVPRGVVDFGSVCGDRRVVVKAS